MLTLRLSWRHTTLWKPFVKLIFVRFVVDFHLKKRGSWASLYFVVAKLHLGMAPQLCQMKQLSLSCWAKISGLLLTNVLDVFFGKFSFKENNYILLAPRVVARLTYILFRHFSEGNVLTNRRWCEDKCVWLVLTACFSLYPPWKGITCPATCLKLLVGWCWIASSQLTCSGAADCWILKASS